MQSENKRLAEYLSQLSTDKEAHKSIETVLIEYKIQIEKISNDLYEKTRNLESLSGKYNILQNNYENEKKENERKESELRTWKIKFEEILRNKNDNDDNNKIKQLLSIKIQENEDLENKIKQLANIVVDKEVN